MSTKVHVGGLSYFCTDHTLRQAFIPFGTVVHAQVLRDECGHSLGLGVVHMALPRRSSGSSMSTSALKSRARAWISGNPQSRSPQATGYWPLRCEKRQPLRRARPGTRAEPEGAQPLADP